MRKTRAYFYWVSLFLLRSPQTRKSEECQQSGPKIDDEIKESKLPKTEKPLNCIEKCARIFLTDKKKIKRNAMNR